MQIPVDRLQNLDKILRVATIQPFQFADNIEAVAAVSVVTEVLHPVAAAVPPVKKKYAVLKIHILHTLTIPVPSSDEKYG